MEFPRKNDQFEVTQKEKQQLSFRARALHKYSIQLYIFRKGAYDPFLSYMDGLDPFSVVKRIFEVNLEDKDETVQKAAAWYFLIEVANHVAAERYEDTIALERFGPYQAMEKAMGEDILSILLAAHFPLTHNPSHKAMPNSLMCWETWADHNEYGVTMEELEPFILSRYQKRTFYQYYLKLKTPPEDLAPKWKKEAERLLKSVDFTLTGFAQHPVFSSRLILEEIDEDNQWEMIMTNEATALWRTSIREDLDKSLWPTWDHFYRLQYATRDSFIFPHTENIPALIELAIHCIYWKPTPEDKINVMS